MVESTIDSATNETTPVSGGQCIEVTIDPFLLTQHCVPVTVGRGHRLLSDPGGTLSSLLVLVLAPR